MVYNYVTVHLAAVSIAVELETQEAKALRLRKCYESALIRNSSLITDACNTVETVC